MRKVRYFSGSQSLNFSAASRAWACHRKPKIFLKLELWTSLSTLAHSSSAGQITSQLHSYISSIQFPIMAEGGIDRKADERMEFTTSKDVTVAPTFQVGDENTMEVLRKDN